MQNANLQGWLPSSLGALANLDVLYGPPVQELHPLMYFQKEPRKKQFDWDIGNLPAKGNNHVSFPCCPQYSFLKQCWGHRNLQKNQISGQIPDLPASLVYL